MRLRLKNIVTGSQDFISPPSQASSGSSTADSKRHLPKPRYTQANLPFPYECYTDGQGGDCLLRWQSYFIPALLSWARAQDDPFGMNGHLVNFLDKVSNIWEHIYLESRLDDDSKLIVLCVVSLLVLYAGTGSQSRNMKANHDLVQQCYEYLV